MAFREDEGGVHEGAESLSVSRRMTLNLLEREKTRNGGVEAKRCRVGWDDGYADTLLAGLLP